MKKVLAGLFALASFSTFANNQNLKNNIKKITVVSTNCSNARLLLEIKINNIESRMKSVNRNLSISRTTAFTCSDIEMGKVQASAELTIPFLNKFSRLME
jgi:glycine betaine/choline ABC-type transport system substrate-binding protein